MSFLQEFSCLQRHPQIIALGLCSKVVPLSCLYLYIDLAHNYYIYSDHCHRISATALRKASVGFHLKLSLHSGQPDLLPLGRIVRQLSVQPSFHIHISF